MRAARWLALASGVMALAVMAGAFGAHALKPLLSEAQRDTWHTAVLYHLVHGVVLLALALAMHVERLAAVLNRYAWLMLLGLLLFSGSLYVWVLTGWQPLVFLTPLGGSLWVFAWGWLGWWAWGQALVSPEVG